MLKKNLQTPCTLLNLDILEKNINLYQKICSKYDKELWPMVKTHKSSEIAKMQSYAGAKGFLCGTIDECECLCNEGISNIMYAYPVASSPNISRIIELAKVSNFIIRLDSYNSASMLNDAAKKANIKVNYSIIIDSGLHRLGINPRQVNKFADSIKHFKNLLLWGISTHPGHAYNATNIKQLNKCVHEEKNAMKIALNKLRENGYIVKFVSSGSTPTYFKSVDDENILIYHPGNYVFNDYIQITNGIASEGDCSLSVLSTVISHPSENTYIIDAGSKTLGLDQGAHDYSRIHGYGYVKKHPELVIVSLSEEVGKVYSEKTTNIRIGDKIEIIPNHACSTANLTNYLVGYRGDSVVKLVKINMRSNSSKII